MSDAMSNPFRCWVDQLEWVDFVKRICKSSLMVVLVYGDSLKRVQSKKENQSNEGFVNSCKMWNPNFMWEHSDHQKPQEEDLRKKVTGF